jgi:hypothetical protein
MGLETKTNVILRARATKSCARLEGWLQALNLLPSFETLGALRRALRMTVLFSAGPL